MSTIEQALAKKLAKQQKSESDPTEAANLQSENSTTETLESSVQTQSVGNDKQVSNIQTAEPNAVTEAVATHKNKVLQIDLERLAFHDFIVNQNINEQRILKEEFRQIKRKLINNAFGVVAKTLTHSNLIMITSARPNEGKTFVSINLALSIALEQDKTVLLVDADVLKPSVLKEFGCEPQTGLIEYLLDNEVGVGDIIYNTNINNLKVIPAGTPHHLSNELLASERMVKLAEELSSRYPDRIVIFDSPPLLGVNETPVLAQLMGQALITVEENKTAVSDLNNASKLLSDELAKGVVLNKAYNSRKEIYGYYGYSGYGYGQESSD